MKETLIDFQESALSDIHKNIRRAHTNWDEETQQIITFSAPTGSGKTLVMTKVIEDIIYGSEEVTPDPNSTFVWLSDMPSLNLQSRYKIESFSDKIRIRDMVNIDSSFDEELFDKGKIYFLNTQKLGQDKLLVKKSDARQYTIWETIENTAKRRPHQFYIIIDEAHRGMYSSPQEENTANSIMQKFIVGSTEDGLSPLPFIIGMTATPERFQRIVGSRDGIINYGINIDPARVRSSGLLKDRIIVHYPKEVINADMTMFKRAVEDWQQKVEKWKEYYESSDKQKDMVKPLLVVQVEDACESAFTKTDVASCIEVFEQVTGKKLNSLEVGHSFDGKGTIEVGGLDISYCEPSRIQEMEDVKLVFFKMSLSTGWDCPRAETMMSFRNAQDYTYIAQLLGRMVRTPLARRIINNVELNNVHLFLPYYDERTVKQVIESLKENDSMMPSDVVEEHEYETLSINQEYSVVINDMKRLITYKIEPVKKYSSIKRLMALARGIASDFIEPSVYASTKEEVLEIIKAGVDEIKTTGKYEDKVKAITGLDIGAVIFDFQENAYLPDEENNFNVMDVDINTFFKRAGNVLGEGLNYEYWRKYSSEEKADVEIKLEVIVFSSSEQQLKELFSRANDKFRQLFSSYIERINLLDEDRYTFYENLVKTSSDPICMPWTLPSTIEHLKTKSDVLYEKHLYVNSEKKYMTFLKNEWERDVIDIVLKKGAIAWLRNEENKPWAFQLPYEMDKKYKAMFPDFLIVRKEGDSFHYDILEPHDYTRTDNVPKVKGMKAFAVEHPDIFDRILLIRKLKGLDSKEHYYALDVKNADVQESITEEINDDGLKELFDKFAIRIDD